MPSRSRSRDRSATRSPSPVSDRSRRKSRSPHSIRSISKSRSPSRSRTPSDYSRRERRNGERGRTRSRSASRPRDASYSRSRSRSRSPAERNRSYSRSLSAGSPVRKSTKVSPGCFTMRLDLLMADSIFQVVVEKLTKNVTEAHVQEIFGSYGAIQSIDMPMNRQCKSFTCRREASSYHL